MSGESSARRCQIGFTLVELMVSMAISLLMVLALVTLLININRNNLELTRSNQVIENGRFALQLLASDVAHAGYWGGFVPAFDDLTTVGVPADVPTAVPDPCLAYPLWEAAPYTTDGPPRVSHRDNLLGIAAQAYGIAAGVPVPLCASRISSPKAKTDVLVVRHVETCAAGVDDCPEQSAGDLYFQVARCGIAAAHPAYVFDTTSLSLTDRDCTHTVEVRKFVSNLYYVRNYAVTPGDGIPALMRSEFGLSGTTLTQMAAQAMVEGIEGFRVEFGIDNLSNSGAAVNHANAIVWADPARLRQPVNRGDGVPDGAFVHCSAASPCTADQLMNATAVKLYVLVRSEGVTPGYTDGKTYLLGTGTLGPFNDGYMRHVFSQTVRLNNVAARREVP